MHACVFIAVLWVLCPLLAAAGQPTPPVGLSLFFQNGAMAPLTLVGDAPRYVQEIDIVATVTTSTDEGIQPIIDQGDLSRLDWRGVTMVEEDWRPGFDGATFIRQRFYRGARWMERPSSFQINPVDDNGHVVSAPLFAAAGSDNRWGPTDDGFVRRFVARQIATGCPAVGDCTGATFTAQGLVQVRDALHAEWRATRVAPEATRLVLVWTADPEAPRTVQVTRASPADFPFGYGFQVSLQELSLPAHGSFYVPGEAVSFRVTFCDGQGVPLHPPGALPTYGQFLRGEIPSGLRYVDLPLSPTLYYALKHRESNMLSALSGPLDSLRVSQSLVGSDQFFAPQLTMATVAVDGFSAVAQTIPPGAILLGGFADPSLWELAMSDVLTFTIPPDALPGTYVAAIKARREFGGEALNRGATVDIQVGTIQPSTFIPQTGPCTTCHKGSSDFAHILHGIQDRRTCFGCHGALIVEPDNALDIRVHAVHDRSDRFAADINNCSLCHLTPTDGPARGVLPK